MTMRFPAREGANDRSSTVAMLGLTGALTLDAQGDPNSVFVFQAASTLTTASASHVNLINGAQPCNVFWQLGSSATFGTTSAFVGNVMALTSISLNNGVTLQGRALARNGSVTLINDTISAAHCAPGTTGGDAGTSGPPGPGAPAGSGASLAPNQNGSAIFTTVSRSVATTVARYGITRCVDRSFRAVVTGVMIRRVVFSVGTHVIATRTRAPFEAVVKGGSGIRTVSARVSHGCVRLANRSITWLARRIKSGDPVTIV